MNENGNACVQVSSIFNADNAPPQIMAANIMMTDTENRENIAALAKRIGSRNTDYLITSIGQELPFHTVILCFATAATIPDYCIPMKREPTVPTGTIFAENISEVLWSAYNQNPSIHDGAIIFLRSEPKETYHVAAWSARLTPPFVAETVKVNKGSAYNSSLSMSLVDHVDAVVIIGMDSVSVFIHGNEMELMREHLVESKVELSGNQ